MSPWTFTYEVDSARHRTRTMIAAGIGTTVLLASCQPDRAVPGGDSPPVDADAEPRLVDPDGFVEAHTFLLPAPDREVLPYLDEPVVVLDVDDPISTRVVWTGLPCQVAPSVEVSGDPDRLRITTVDRGLQVLAEGEACESSEDFFVVDLTFTEAAATASVDVSTRCPTPEDRQAATHPGNPSTAWHGIRRHVESCTLLPPR